MKKGLLLLVIVGTLLVLTGCFNHHNPIKNEKINKSENDSMELIENIDVIIDNEKYTAKMENNETTRLFVDRLPQTFKMAELNGNEKYFYMDYSLPTNLSNPKHIVAGDIMLYGNDCLVIFYKSFNTNYSYTKIGHIYDLPELGKDNVTVTFERP